MQIVIFGSALAFLFFLIWYLASTEGSTKRWIGLAAIIASLLTCGLSLYPVQEKVRLGLDLKGGFAFTIELEGSPTKGALEQAMEVFRKRIDTGGLIEAIIQPIGTNRISVQIPGVSNEARDKYRKQLGQVAHLEFKIVHPQNDALVAEYIKSGKQPPYDYQVLMLSDRDKTGKKVQYPIMVKRRAEMSGKYVSTAFRTYGELGLPEVSLQFNADGKKLFGQVTEANKGNRLAIVLDGEVKSAPNINEPIFGGSARISGGGMSSEEAEELSSVLENPLESLVKIVEERGVDPSLGADSVESGKKAAIYAFLGVIFFMVAYYRLAGMVSVVALVVNLVIMLGLLAQFHFTLTLPGIAGIVLTIGMAVDANVLIYERIRDELEMGKPLRAAIEAGFERAFSAIFDSNITTMIPAIVLIFLGSGPLQGFAVTLTLGIVANLFAALVVSKNVFDWMLVGHGVRNLTMMRFLHNPKFDFLSARWIALVASLAVLLWGGLAFQQKGKDLMGVDFVGGDALTLSYQQQVPVAEVRSTLQKNGIGESLIQYSVDAGKLSVQVKLNEGERTEEILKSSFPAAGFKHASMDRVGPQVGEELSRRALFALALGLLGILVYAAIRFEWSFAVAAAVGQLHDVLIALCIMAVLGREFTLSLVGAFLTIAGYSINDKIVVFDRIRERMHLKEKGTFFEIINRALNLTLARTLLTGGTVIIATLSLIFFGGSVIHDFSVAMLIGLLSGIYSSHFISPPLAWWLDNYKDRKRRKRPAPAGVKTV
jgi:SecD/SecF fusion protein